jgi:hypothetical protein
MERGCRTPRYRHALPQLSGDLFLTDAGVSAFLRSRPERDAPDLQIVFTRQASPKR